MAEEKKRDEFQPYTPEMLRMSGSVQGMMGLQFIETSTDKDLVDKYISAINSLDLKISAYLRRFKDRLIKDYEANGGYKPEHEEEVCEKLYDHWLNKKLVEIRHTKAQITSYFTDREKSTPDEVMREVIYIDLGNYSRLENTVTGMLDDEDLPIIPEATADEMYMDHYKMRLQTRLKKREIALGLESVEKSGDEGLGKK